MARNTGVSKRFRYMSDDERFEFGHAIGCCNCDKGGTEYYVEVRTGDRYCRRCARKLTIKDQALDEFTKTLQQMIRQPCWDEMAVSPIELVDRLVQEITASQLRRVTRWLKLRLWRTQVETQS